MLLPSDIKDALNSPDLNQSLLVLRAYRETYLESLKCDLPDSFENHLERVADQGNFSNSSGHYMLVELSRDHKWGSAEKVDLFIKLCRRIAKLERQACGHYIPSELQTA